MTPSSVTGSADARYGTYAVMAWLAELDLTAMWGDGPGAKSRAATSRAILQTIANFVDEHNRCHPGNAKIAAHCDNRSKQTIQDHLGRAVQVGLLTKQRVMLGSRRGRDVLTFQVGTTQQQLEHAAAASPWTGRARKDPTGHGDVDRRVAELEAEIERLRGTSGPGNTLRDDDHPLAESRVGMTVIPSQKDAEGPVDNRAEPTVEGMTGHPFRRDDPSSLPIRTTPVNHSSSSSLGSATDAAGADEEDDVDELSVVGGRLRAVHPEIRVELLMRRLAASGIDPTDVDLVAAAAEVLAASVGRGQRVGDPTAYVAASIAREPWRWPARPAEFATYDPGTPGASVRGCAEGVHRWVPSADGTTFCGRCSADGVFVEGPTETRRAAG